MHMKSILIRDFNSQDEAVRKAIQILKKNLNKGDIILTSPRFKNIRLKIMNLPSYIISTLSRGITHSCIYLGKNEVLDVDFRLMGKDVQKVNLEELLRKKISRFKGIKIYVVQPKKYKKSHRAIVLKRAIDEFIVKGKIKLYYYTELFKIFFKLKINGHKSFRKQKPIYNYKWHCSNLVAYLLKNANVPIGKRAFSTYIPSTFLFSRHFKIKKKVVIK